MTPNDVLARIVETHICDDLLSWEEAQVLADALEDNGRDEEARLIRMRDRPLFVAPDLHDQWMIQELRLLPKQYRRGTIRVRVEGCSWRCNPSQSTEPPIVKPTSVVASAPPHTVSTDLTGTATNGSRTE